MGVLTAKKNVLGSKKSTGFVTLVARETLIEVGSRLRGAYLIEQAKVTLELAKLEGKPLEVFLPIGFLNGAERAFVAVEAGLGNRTILAEEAKDATRLQNETLRRVRVWRRKLAALGRMAQRFGEAVPATLTTIGFGSRGVAATVKSLEETLALLSQERERLERFPLFDTVFGEGKALLEALSTADATQEVKRLKTLPEAVRAYYAAKGTLYQGLKIVNDAGRALYAADVVAASRFNLSILYRTPGRRIVEPTVTK